MADLREILSKMERYCAGQERCEQDVRKRLAPFALPSLQLEDIIGRLKASDFLNETRYAEIFVRSKLKDQWGKLKIRQALSSKRIAPETIDVIIDGIDPEQYRNILNETIAKWLRMHPEDPENGRAKLIRAMLAKGFAIDEVMPAIREQNGEKSRF